MARVYRAARPRVRVREGRRGRRLEVDGSFASYWSPARDATGPVWDALALPVLALPPGRRRRALLLGLGGGSAARRLRALAPAARIVAVEISPEVVRAARRWFELDALSLEVRCCDARAFLARSRGGFDLVIDDVFVGAGDAVEKPDWMLEEGLLRARARLSPGGILVSNALDEAREARARLRALFPRVLEIGVEGYDNRILVGGPASLDAARLRRAARREPGLATSLESLRLRRVG